MDRDNIDRLATPNKRKERVESDTKENPYLISPYALKYKATPRIEELAKPFERR